MYYTFKLHTCQLLYGRPWEIRTPNFQFRRLALYPIELRADGPATRNRTWINSLEGYCSIRWTIASCMVPFPRLERGTHSFWESRVYQLRQKGIVWYQESESNQPHPILQTGALPTELSWHWYQRRESNSLKAANLAERAYKTPRTPSLAGN